MRLDPQIVAQLVCAAHEVFGANAGLWLFGSRVDEQARGGDIDLYLEADVDVDLLEKRLAFLLRLEHILGEQKVDVVIRPRHRPLSPIHRIALKTGIQLC
jgi:predicted nucleotidyltransferase